MIIITDTTNQIRIRTIIIIDPPTPINDTPTNQRPILTLRLTTETITIKIITLGRTDLITLETTTDTKK
mgnify:CR=1 FL=1